MVVTLHTWLVVPIVTAAKKFHAMDLVHVPTIAQVAPRMQTGKLTPALQPWPL